MVLGSSGSAGSSGLTGANGSSGSSGSAGFMLPKGDNAGTRYNSVIQQ
jgi:hypothetical protein